LIADVAIQSSSAGGGCQAGDSLTTQKPAPASRNGCLRLSQALDKTGAVGVNSGSCLSGPMGGLICFARVLLLNATQSLALPIIGK